VKQQTNEKTIGAIALGCDKNRVDLEKMLYKLKSAGFCIVSEPSEADLVLVNTCGFIEIARAESVNAILSACALKQNGKVKKVVVTGCLPQKNFEELTQTIPEVDAFLRLADSDNIAQTVSALLGVTLPKQLDKVAPERVLTTHPSYAFLKISDGCNNGCAYCTIPKIRGAYQSVPMKSLVREAEGLARMGVKELVLVAQDTTRYGSDLPTKPTLVGLVQALSQIEGIAWIRLHYCYPEKVDNALLQEIATNPKVCKYIDVPFQHIDNDMLKRMNRRSNEQQIRSLVTQIKNIERRIAIRTTFIVGLPGESRKAFQKLCAFVKSSQFEMAGFFSYSKEEGTAAYFMKQQVPSLIKKLRLRKIKKIQAQSLKAFATQMIGQTYQILIDSYYNNMGESYAIGRTEHFSPMVDFEVKIECSSPLATGQFITAKITNFIDGMFIGEVV